MFYYEKEPKNIILELVLKDAGYRKYCAEGQVEMRRFWNKLRVDLQQESGKLSEYLVNHASRLNLPDFCNGLGVKIDNKISQIINDGVITADRETIRILIAVCLEMDAALKADSMQSILGPDTRSILNLAKI